MLFSSVSVSSAAKKHRRASRKPYLMEKFFFIESENDSWRKLVCRIVLLEVERIDPSPTSLLSKGMSWPERGRKWKTSAWASLRNTVIIHLYPWCACSGDGRVDLGSIANLMKTEVRVVALAVAEQIIETNFWRFTANDTMLIGTRWYEIPRCITSPLLKVNQD